MWFKSKNRKKFTSEEELKEARKAYKAVDKPTRAPHISSQQATITTFYNEDGSVEGYYLEGRKLKANIFEDFKPKEEKK